MLQTPDPNPHAISSPISAGGTAGYVRNAKYTPWLTIIALLLLSMAPGYSAQQVEGSQPRLWDGHLVEASKTACSVEVAGAAQKGACPVSMSTTEFALVLRDGRLLKLDEGGNQKAVEALKKSRNGSKAVFDYWKSGKISKQIRARIMGTLTSEVLNVDTIRID